MLIFFSEHPTVGNSYQFTNMLTGEVEQRRVIARVKKRRGRDVYFEATMKTLDGRSITAEYEIDIDNTISL